MNSKLRALGARFAVRNGIEPIRKGQKRPVGFYMVNHATGEPVVANRASVVLEGALDAAVLPGEVTIVRRRA